MKRKLAKIVSLALAIITMASSSVRANEVPLVNESTSSDSTVEPRSAYLASGISKITNEGEGVLGVYADFAAYSDVPWAQITINLESRKGTSGSWSLVDTYVYEFTPDDDPEGRLHAEAVAFDVYGLTTNYYYRLRCTHKVQTPSGSYETKYTQTDGVLLTSYPVYRSADEIE